MVIDDELLYKQILALAADDIKPINFKWTGEFVYDTTVLPVLNVIGFTMLSDYNSKLTDTLVVKVQIRRSDRIDIDKFNKSLLRFRLINTVTRPEDATDEVGVQEVLTYDAWLLDNTSTSVARESRDDNYNNSDNLGGLIEIDIQLTEVGFGEFRTLEVSGVYNKVTMQDMLQGLLSREAPKLDNSSYNVNVITPDNNRIYYQSLIPSGTKLIDLPKLLQSKYGIYATGMSYYLTKKTWFIYPLYRHKETYSKLSTLTILNVPSNEMAKITNSYIVNEGGIFIFATGKSRHTDDSISILSNNGVGWKSANGNNVMDGYRTHSKGISTIAPGDNNLLYQFNDIKDVVSDRTPLLNSDVKLTTNPLAMASDITKGLGSLVDIIWESSNHSLLFPGMPVIYLYKQGGKVQRMLGTLLGAETEVQSVKRNITDNRYVSNTNLTIYAQREFGVIGHP